ncbi:DUF84 family protein [Metabacillus sp. RGM 3146]|uniref:DUF84 family protein n=1 Tax=Metabacillus sp. RGM 3146 TaxID=3401092 RepID=UPI003B9DBE6E
MKIAIGTMNPVKINAIKNTFQAFDGVTFKPIAVSSGVSKQPLSDEETLEGAVNRANNALVRGEADAGIGLEGGIAETKEGYFLCNWGALSDGSGKPIVAGGARILLPEEIGREVKDGRELGDVMDEYTSLNNVRQNEGAIGIFTAGLVNRTDMFIHVASLIAGQLLFRHPEWKRHLQ